jgi:poly(A) polymerase
VGITPSHIPHTESRDAATHIVRALAAHGHIAYFAGGCVRDELLGLVPTDYDVATDAIPTRIAELFPKTAHVGASFGVMLVKIGRVVVEVATFRADGNYSDNRRPDSVRFSTPEEDAQRRDFTVNALFLDPLAPSPTPTIIDHVSGLPDLAARVLRAVGNPDARLNEDHLRALRAARLAAKLGLTIDPATARAIRNHAAHLSGVSRERIGEEVRRMLGHPSRATAAALLRDLALEGPVLTTSPARPHDATPSPTPTTTFPRLSAIAPTDSMAIFPMALAAWALDLALPGDAAAQLRSALCLSNDDLTWLRAILSHHHALISAWPTATIAQQKRLAASKGFAEALEILRATDPAAAATIATHVSHLSQTHGGLAPLPLIDGDHLLRLNLPPGPAFKRILDHVYDAQLEGHVRDLAGATALALHIAATPPQ